MHNLQESFLHHSLQISPYVFLSIKEVIVILNLYTGLDQKTNSLFLLGIAMEALDQTCRKHSVPLANGGQDGERRGTEVKDQPVPV